MDGAFGSSSDRFAGSGDGFHRPSQSTTGNHAGLAFSPMMTPQLAHGAPGASNANSLPAASANGGVDGGSGSGAGTAPGSGTGTSTGTAAAAAAAGSTAYESHDDLCVDSCMGVGLYNGFQQFNHRGGQPSLQARWARDSSISRDHDPTGLGALPLHFRAEHFAPPTSSPYPPWFNQHVDAARVPCSDEDCRSMGDMSCCDSQCTMTGKCTDVACADTEDACTDQNCPSRPVPTPSSEVVSGAAALISINHHAPEQSHHNFNLQQQGEARPCFFYPPRSALLMAKP